MSAFFSRRKSSHTAQASGQWVRIETCPLAKTGHLWTVLCQELRFFFKKVTASAMGCRSIAASYNMEYLEVSPMHPPIAFGLKVVVWPLTKNTGLFGPNKMSGHFLVLTYSD